MKFYITLYLFLFLQSLLYSQNNKIDSLINFQNTLEDDTNKVLVYESLIEQLATEDISILKEYAIRGINLAKSLNYSKGRRTCYFLFIKALIKKELFEEAQGFNLKYYGLCEKELDLEGMRLAFMVNGGLITEIKEHEETLKAAAEKREKERKEAMILAENKRQNLIIYAVSTVSALLFLLIAVILRSLNINKQKNKLITEQKELVEEKQKEIIDSITYAKRIQQALLPTEKYIARNLKN